MGNYDKNIFSKLSRGDREKKAFTGVWERAELALINFLPESSLRVLDPSQILHSRVPRTPPTELSRSYQHMAWQEPASPHPESRADGALWGETAASYLTFQRFCRVMITTSSFPLFPKHPVFVNRSAPRGSSAPTS